MINLNGISWSDLTYENLISSLESDINESFFLEFKEDNVSPEKILKATSAFANSYGGYIIIGVNDDKTIDKGCVVWNEQRLHSTYINGISPIPNFDVKTLTKDDKRILVIRVMEGEEPPYITYRGEIYERVSSGSTLIKSSERLNVILEKNNSYLRGLSQKIDIPDISSYPNNYCGYIDLGFSLNTHDDFPFKKDFMSLDLTPTIEFIRASHHPYSFSRLFDSFVITIGEKRPVDGKQVLFSGLSYMIEVMRDGSVRYRIPLIASVDNYEEVSYIEPFIVSGCFQDIYSSLIGPDVDRFFISAKKYVKLVVQKQFKPIFDPQRYPGMEYNDDFVKRELNHYRKYGDNLIAIGHRIPTNGFMNIDRKFFNERNIDLSKESLLDCLFFNGFLEFGFIDEFKLENN